MPTHKLTPEIINAAIGGFEQQNLHNDAQIAELRSMLPGGRTEPAAAPEVPKGKRRKMSAAARKRIGDAQRKRWAESKGQSESPSETVGKTEAQDECCWPESNLRSHQGTLGCIPFGKAREEASPRREEGTCEESDGEKGSSEGGEEENCHGLAWPSWRSNTSSATPKSHWSGDLHASAMDELVCSMLLLYKKLAWLFR
jgi:hypothetical protein